MIIKGFRWNIILRVLLIAALTLLLSYVLTNRNWFFTPLVIILILIVATWSLIHYIEKTNKDLTHFILSIKQRGFTTTFPPGKRGKTFTKLSEAFNDVIEEFRKINLQRETHYQYLQAMTENIQVGILSFDRDGKIELANPAALQLLGVMRISNIIELSRINPKISRTINELKSGERHLMRAVIGQKELHLSIQLKELTMNDLPFKIVLIQDLNRELEAQEVDAWQKLIRVLTHEIMNSVTPIVSLTEAVNSMLAGRDGSRRDFASLDRDDKEDLYGSLQTIEKRSKGLLRFVNAYKDFTKVPELIFGEVDVLALVKRVVNLFKAELKGHEIIIEKIGNENTVLATADAEWLEQVLINVVKNSIEALEGKTNPQISIAVGKDGHQTFIRVHDNGPGMDKETLDQVFVPFFTTKKRGTGIGLSLSRQIMRLHKGTLHISSEAGKGTEVALSW